MFDTTYLKCEYNQQENKNIIIFHFILIFIWYHYYVYTINNK